MSIFEMFDKLRELLLRMARYDYEEHHPRIRPKISLIIPYKYDNPQRDLVFKWVLQYWRDELPEAEIIIGSAWGKVFAKTRAFNNAFRKSTGKVIVLLDADAYLPGSVIDKCADRILEDLDNHLWFVPYRNLYRLKRWITELIISSDPANPLRLPSPPPKEMIEGEVAAKYGRRYGAMIMIMPREAIDVLGGFDERFRGWGGEDVAILRALDTLWGKHKTTNNDLLHLWHPRIGESFKEMRWKGQMKKLPNSELALRYHRATGKPDQMQQLVDEALKSKRRVLQESVTKTAKVIKPKK